MLQAEETRVTPATAQRYHIPLAERMEKALTDGAWDSTTVEITQEDRDWLDMPSIGEEVV